MLTTSNRLPTKVEIRQRAQEIYRARGGQAGREIDDWLQAEYELMQLPLAHLAKLAATPNSNHSPLAVAEIVQVALLIGGFMKWRG